MPASPSSSIDVGLASSALADDVQFLGIKAFAGGTRVANERLAPLGLRARTYAVLALVCEHSDPSQRELSEFLALDPSQIVALVNELVVAGLVSREVDPSDRRANVIRATPDGRARMEQAKTVIAGAESESLAGLTGHERATLRALLRKAAFASEPAVEAPDADTTLLYLVKQVELAIRNHLDRVVSGAGLTALQYTALTVLERHPGLTSSQLARNSFVRPQTMAEMVTGLESDGFIARERDARSQRQLPITLTPHGREVLEALRGPVAELESDMTGGLDARQLAEFRSALQSCRRALGLGAR